MDAETRRTVRERADDRCEYCRLRQEHAPLWRHQIERAPAHPSAEIYAWGRVAGFMLTGRSSKEALSLLPASGKDVLGPCVDVTPEKRPDARWVLDRLENLPC